MQQISNIGRNIKKYRGRLSLTQDALSRKSVVKYTTLSKIESGSVKRPTVYIVAKIAKTLGVGVDDLIK